MPADSGYQQIQFYTKFAGNRKLVPVIYRKSETSSIDI